jgi:serine/threonine protein kinase
MRIARERRERAAAVHEAEAAAQDSASGVGRVVSGIAVAGSEAVPGAPSSNAAWLAELDAETAEREELELRMAFREIPVMELEMLGTLGQGITAVVRHARWWHDDSEGEQGGGSSRSLVTPKEEVSHTQHPGAGMDTAADADVDADVDVEERAMTEVAVKEFTAASASARPPAQIQAFMRELAALHRVPPHPNLVQVLGACTHPQLRLVIEYMPFGDLFGAIRSSSPPDFLVTEAGGEEGAHRADPAAKLVGPGGVAMTLRTRVRLAQDVAAGLAHLHRCNRVHRDLKCHNILLDVSESQLRAKLGDFGTTLMLDEWRTDAESKSAGTRGYVAPELLVPPEPVAAPADGLLDATEPAACIAATRSAAVDVFALGVVMWELMAEDPEWGNPLKGIADRTLIARLKDGESPPLSDKVPGSYRDLVRKCWSLHAAHRPTAKQVADTLRGLLDQLH